MRTNRLSLLLALLLPVVTLAQTQINPSVVPVTSRWMVYEFASAYSGLSLRLHGNARSYYQTAVSNYAPGSTTYRWYMSYAQSSYQAAVANANASVLLGGLALQLAGQANDTSLLSLAGGFVTVTLDNLIYLLNTSPVRSAAQGPVASAGSMSQVSLQVGDEAGSWEVTFTDSAGHPNVLSLDADADGQLDPGYQAGGVFAATAYLDANGNWRIETSNGTLVLSALGTCLSGCQVPGATVIFPDPDAMGSVCSLYGVCGNPNYVPTLRTYDALAPDDP